MLCGGGPCVHVYVCMYATTTTASQLVWLAVPVYVNESEHNASICDYLDFSTRYLCSDSNVTLSRESLAAGT